MLSAEGYVFARAWELAEPAIETTGKLLLILETARLAVEALPALAPWPVSGWDAKTTIDMLVDLSPNQHAADFIYDLSLEQARNEQAEGRR
jgi:hypothetical protein